MAISSQAHSQDKLFAKWRAPPQERGELCASASTPRSLLGPLRSENMDSEAQETQFQTQLMWFPSTRLWTQLGSRWSKTPAKFYKWLWGWGKTTHATEKLALVPRQGVRKPEPRRLVEASGPSQQEAKEKASIESRPRRAAGSQGWVGGSSVAQISRLAIRTASKVDKNISNGEIIWQLTTVHSLV